ncbi:MAG TPA: META domain-containing protein [Allosphingosinicella sp.]|nr:META domain-containing protein [Allosphingosinicella sp.]
MIWSDPDGTRIDVARPRPVTGRNGVHVYRTPRMTVEISHQGRCNHGMSDYEYPDTVRVFIGPGRGGRPLEGCGGGILPPVTLADTSWSIVDIDGAQVGGEEYELQFDGEGRLSGRAGCNRFSGPYAQQGRFLTAGVTVTQARPCPDAPGAHQRKVLQLLGGPVQISFRGGMIMSLQESRNVPGIFITLRRQ